MPNIREYNSTQALQGIRPNELGADALAQSGRRIAAVYHQSGEELGQGAASIGRSAKDLYDETQKTDSTQEISVGSASLANLTNDLTKQWNHAANTADLNDHTIADNFQQNTLEPSIEKWQQGFTTPGGQKWALGEANRMRSHFFEKTAGDMAHRAGDALVTNLQTTLNASSALARNDPSSMAHAIDLYKSSVEGLVANMPNLDANAGTKARTEQFQKGAAQIAMAAGIGMAEKNPQALQAEIDKGTFDNYLDVTQKKQLGQYAQGQQTHQKTLLDQQSKDVASGYVLKTFDPASQRSQPITIDDFAKVSADPRMRPEDKVSALKQMQTEFAAQQREATGKAASDPNVLAGFRARFSGDPAQYPTQAEIGLALGKGELTRADAGSLRESTQMLTEGAKKDPIGAELFKDSLATAHQQILGRDPPSQASAAQRSAMQRFDAWFYPNYQKALASGMSPTQLLSPDSEGYMLKPETMKQFGISGSDIVAAPAGRPAPAYRPPLSQFFGAKPPPQPAPAKPMTDQQVIDNPKGGA